jgi:radical SAM-linked protein
MTGSEISRLLVDELLPLVFKPGQYLGNEWGARRKPFASCDVRLALAFPDMYELGMSNFGLKILYQLVNDFEGLLVDRTYAPGSDLEALMREHRVPLFGFESKEAVANFELLGFSLQYELTYTNVLNMLDLAGLSVKSEGRRELFPLVFGGGPSAVNPEPMALFMDFFIIGDGEIAVPAVMNLIRRFKANLVQQNKELGSGNFNQGLNAAFSPEQIKALRLWLLLELAATVGGVYVPALYESTGAESQGLQNLQQDNNPVVSPVDVNALVSSLVALLPQFEVELNQLRTAVLPRRVLRQVAPLNESNQPTRNLVPYLALVHDRETLEVRRGCDRGCRFCQPGYTFLPVRERSAGELVELSKQALANSGHEEYSLLSLCVSDYTSLHESVRALNREHSAARASLSFPSQRADRMNLDLAEELKQVRKSGITLAPEAGTEKLRAVINKGLSHAQIINAIESAYKAGWQSVKLYFMCCLPFEDDSDLDGIIEILKEADRHCQVVRRGNPEKYKRSIEMTCTISNFVPKPFTPFQWFAQVTPEETLRKQKYLKARLRESGLRKVTLNVTEPQISLLEAVISRGDRQTGELIYRAWQDGAVFDAWDDRFRPVLWHNSAQSLGYTLEQMACTPREPGSKQAFDIVHIGLHDWWLLREWEKATREVETAACTENTCHACGICTELETNHILANPSVEAMKKNPFVKELNANDSDEESHPSLFFVAPPVPSVEPTNTRLRFTFTKVGDLRFIGHLDMQNLLIRAARRAALKIAHTQGFNPSPKISLACPLPLFQEGLRELAEIELTEEMTCEELKLRLNAQLPAEVQIIDCQLVPPPGPHAPAAPSVASLVRAARYRAVLLPLPGNCRPLPTASADLAAELESAVKAVMESEHLYAQGQDADLNQSKKNAQGKDIRPGIYSVRLLSDSSENQGLPIIEFEIATGSQGHIKPTDVLGQISVRCPALKLNWRITRLELLTQAQSEKQNQVIGSATG